MTLKGKFQLVTAALIAFAVGTLILALYLASNPYEAKDFSRISGNTQLPDMRAIEQIPERKDTFINLLAPMVERKNAKLASVREELQAMQQTLREGALGNVQSQRLEHIARHYKLADKEELDTAALIDRLLRRVDQIPGSMVLAQAAAESGWGTSRFARQANNLFGQWCYSKGCGLVPKRRSAGASHEVQKFRSLEAAINAYYRNINTHRAYRGVRAKRAALRQAGEPLTGPALITGLTQYSSRGQVYVDELAELIRYNKLTRYDG